MLNMLHWKKSNMVNCMACRNIIFLFRIYFYLSSLQFLQMVAGKYHNWEIITLYFTIFFPFHSDPCYILSSFKIMKHEKHVCCNLLNRLLTVLLRLLSNWNLWASTSYLAYENRKKCECGRWMIISNPSYLIVYWKIQEWYLTCLIT
jgi:hypothetical protein